MLHRTLLLLALCALVGPSSLASAQGVTTGSLAGVVTDDKQQPVAGASVIAIHEPSGTTYEATTRNDGGFTIAGMRVGGPYSVTVAHNAAAGTAFVPQTKSDLTVNLGTATDVSFTVSPVKVAEEVTVTGAFDPVFSSSHTGAATSISRSELSSIPTISGRLTDATRLTPQSNGSSIAGSDGRMNNITVDGSSFNSSFGVSASQPGDRTGVAPISLEAIEQVQVNIAPYDVRQGSFIGAGVNTVTRSGGNRVNGSFFHRFRNQDWVGTETKGSPFNPGTFEFRNTGGWASGPVIRNKWFAFGNYEDELDTRPLTTWRARNGSEPVTGNVTRVLQSDLDTLSNYLSTNFGYETGPYSDLPDETPAKRFLLRNDYNLNNSNKISFRYNHLNSFTDIGMSNSTSALRGRNAGSSSFLTFQNSNYQILENIRSGIGEWNSVFGTMTNSFQAGFTYQDESRDTRGGDVFPFVEIFEGGQSYTAFGFEPFSFNNELRYKTLQFQNNLSRFGAKHTQTFGVYAERFQSENVFFSCCPQSAYSYNSLADFYTDANNYLANPNRTSSPVSLAQFQVRYSNIPGDDKATQELDVWYTAGYAQDEWRVRPNLTLTSGIRFDVTRFNNESFANPAADALSFRDETGQSVRYETGRMPDPKILWSPRVGLNWDVNGNQQTQVRGGTGIFSGKPAYVWVSNQIGNTGVLIGEIRNMAPGSTFPFHPDPDHYKAAATGSSATSYTLNVTDGDFKFPQVWRTNIGVDHKLPGGFVSTTEYFFARNLNGVYYIDANLPAAQTVFAGPDARPRWTANRINNTPGNVVNNAFVLKNGDGGNSWNFAQTLARTFRSGLSLRAAYSYGESKTLVDPESTAATTFARVTHFSDPNNAGVQNSMFFPGHRAYALVSFSREYFRFGGTTITAFWETRPSTNSGSSRLSYTFASDMNGDGSTNDLIYIPRDTSEMNFAQFTASGRTFTAAEQAAAFEAYIQQDSYLSKHRGQYAQRNALSFPMLRRLDLSIAQDIFGNLGGRRHGFQVRADFLNFGNLLNSNWGAGSRTFAAVNSNNQISILTNPAVDAATGRPTYRFAVVNNELVNRTFVPSVFTSDVYEFMLSLRYTFN